MCNLHIILALKNAVVVTQPDFFANLLQVLL